MVKVSIVMPVYNDEKYLHHAIDSILNQTFNDYEFIIIDDGSTDKTYDVINSFDDKRIKIIENEENKGLAESINIGMRAAGGKYIARMDADDISLPTRLETQVSFLDSNSSVGLVGTWCEFIDEKGRKLFQGRFPTDGNELKESLLNKDQFLDPSVVFRKECIEKVGYLRSIFDVAQCYDLWVRISESYDTANIPEFLYMYRFKRKSIEKGRRTRQIRTGLVISELAKERRQTGKDRLELQGNIVFDSLLDELAPMSSAQVKEHDLEGYYIWADILYTGGNYSYAIELLLRSIAINPFHKASWVLLAKNMIVYVLPEKIINILKNK